jgi:hypothetical protein
MIPSIDDFLERERLKYNQKGLILCMSYKDSVKIFTSGNSMTTVPVKSNMNYRIGGQSIPILTTLFLILVDKKYLKLDDKIGDFLPKVPNGNLITLQMLCNMRSGLEDVIKNQAVNESMTSQVFKQWKTKELLEIVYNTKPLYPPGERFYFGHITNMLLLGEAIKSRMGKSLKCLLKHYIFKQLNLNDIEYSNNQEIKNPVFHTFTNNRISYYEDSTYWNQSWGSHATKINSDAQDVNIIAKNIGEGKLISKKLYKIQMNNPDIKTTEYYGMGVVVGGFGLDYLKTDKYPYTIIWTNESDDGSFGMWAYIPSQKITVNIQSNTFNSDNFSINFILQDLLNTYDFGQLRRIINDDIIY